MSESHSSLKQNIGLPIVYPLTVYRSAMAGYVGGVHPSATVNSAIVNRGVYASLRDSAFSSFGYISGMGLLDHMVLLFCFLRKRAIFEL